MTVHSKIAMVTGAGSGIGKSTALALLKEGYSVVLVGRRREALEQTAAAGPDSARALPIAADVSDPAAVDALSSDNCSSLSATTEFPDGTT
jgi:NADP-dependent 3-hydroxy acid dehydrogenase YdfG